MTQQSLIDAPGADLIFIVFNSHRAEALAP
jgi:hypothetical protein